MTPPIHDATQRQTHPHESFQEKTVTDTPPVTTSPPAIHLVEPFAAEHSNAMPSMHMIRSGRMFFASDVAAILFAFIFGGIAARVINVYVLDNQFHALWSSYTVTQAILFLGLGSIALLWLDARGHYRQRLPYWESLQHVLTVTIVGVIIAGFILFATKESLSRLWIGLSWLLFAILLLAGRACVVSFLQHKSLWKIPVLLIGTQSATTATRKALRKDKYLGYDVAEQLPPDIVQTMSKPHAWRRLLALHGCTHLVLALQGSEIEQYQSALRALVRERVSFSIVPPWHGLPVSTLTMHHFMLHDVMMLQDTNRLNMLLHRLIKRSVDILVSLSALLLVSPLFVVIALCVRSDGGPAFFSQPRIGRYGQRFSCYKFRSMRINAEAYLTTYLAEHPDAALEWKLYQKLRKDVRITPVGNIIRKTSLDELPQLFNVLKGDMSLVGPRPILPGQEEFYGDDFTFYTSVRPGITGPWQVSGRNALTFKERVQLEAYYARNWTLWLDIVILLKTPQALLGKDSAF